MRAIVLDTETTGASKESQVIELAYIALDDSFFSHVLMNRNHLLQVADGKSSIDESLVFEQRYKPSVDIDPRAYEVHGINQLMLKDCPPASSLTVPAVDYAIAHNSSFDKRLLRQTMSDKYWGIFDKIKWIDTLTLAKIFDKQLKIGYENHKLDIVIKFHFPDYAHLLIEDKHKALGDCIKALLFLTVLVEKIPTITSFDQLYNFQEMMKKVK